MPPMHLKTIESCACYRILLIRMFMLKYLSEMYWQYFFSFLIAHSNGVLTTDAFSVQSNMVLTLCISILLTISQVCSQA